MKNLTKRCTKKERKERSDRRRTLRKEHMRINITKVSGSWRGRLWKQIYQAHFLDFEKLMEVQLQCSNKGQNKLAYLYNCKETPHKCIEGNHYVSSTPTKTKKTRMIWP